MSTDTTIPEAADTVIIGAGCVGCSAAYHLSECGRDDIVVIDQGPLFETGGSTSHAPGLVFQTSNNRLLTRLARYTRELYTTYDAFRQCGGIEVAYTDDRWSFLKRKLEYGKAWGIEGGTLLESGEVENRVPLVDPDTIHGGYYVPSDGKAEGVVASERMAQETDSNARFYGHTTVTDLETANGSIETVVTDRGHIEANEVLICTNIWGPLFGEMVGADVPLTPCAHQYLVTEPLSELAGATREVEQPILRHQDYSMYFRQHGESYGMGSYNHDPLLVEPEDILAPEESERMPSIREFTEEHFFEPTHPDIDKSAHAAATELLPPLDGAAFEDRFNGMFSFTPDGMPILGETEGIDGLWWALAVWVTQSGGVGHVMAEWMENGVPRLNGDRIDISGAHIDRFQPHSGSEEFVTARGSQQYQEVYQLIHPREQPQDSRGLRRSPFYPYQAELDAEFYDAGGWEMPQWYGANESLLDEYGVHERTGWLEQNWSPIEGAEHLAVRDRVGVYELTNYTGIEVTGPGATEFLQRLFTNDMDVTSGTVRYTTMLNEAGGILADMTVTRLDSESEDNARYLLLTGGGSSGTEHIRWIRDHAPDDGSVTVTNQGSAQCGLGVAGPNARKLLDPITEGDLSNDHFPYFSARETYVGSVPVTALRVSYVGELGWELYAPMEYGAKLWETVWEAGQDHALLPMGSGALNSMRLEKGFRLWGTDITPEYNPYESGLGFAVDLDTDFIGREALLEAKEQGIDRKIAPLTLDEPGAVVATGKPIVDGENVHGYVVSAEYGHSIDAGIAYGYMPAEFTDPGTDLEIEYEGERYNATVGQEPLFDPEREKILR
jgi:glycine cleavage system aminomethyltransferase T/glycine/D-amino acid oxidase-like deaminating enzyme